ncbi:MAG TPA: aldo/keto reductase [Candidatus Paceibacterota bacterium]|nr:aldo/keto reductase [Verrucomicrobiota bacterium]HRY50351.1 aldo/keto reductase [Candidatus Paceibacterota bacterium]HSA02077.1 aldo/keto reductase [Candidatus Paceibacterota bacterium]
MFKSNRREFIHTALAGAGLLLSNPTRVFSAGSEPPNRLRSASDRVPLGKTGIRASFLAQGTGYNGSSRSSAHTRLGKASLDALLRHSMDQGVNFMDMADLYGSHPFVKDVIKGLPRDKYVLLTKIWPRSENWNKASGGAREEMDRFRQELGVDMIDVCLIHCMTNSRWPQEYERIRDDLSELKQKGVVRALGVSCHDFGALKAAAEHPWVDLIFARINHKGGGEYSMDGTVEEVSQTLKSARANGKAIVGMKIFGAGKLVKPEEKDASLQYVIRENLVDAMTIGMLSQEQVDDSVTRINRTLKNLS